jgi:flagellar hook-associated protein 1 FlgK
MSLSSAINSSVSGLRVTGKWAEITSTNIANITTEGYGRKTLQLTGGDGTSVRVGGVQREMDDAIGRLHRDNIARTERQEATVRGLNPYISTLGGTDSPFSLASQIGRFHGELSLLAADPGNEGLQRAAIASATDLTRGLHRVTDGVEEAGQLARSSAAADTADADGILKRVAILGRQVMQEANGTTYRVALEDDMAAELDKLAGIMDFRVERTPRGEVSIYTTSGAPLVLRNNALDLSYDRQTGRLSTGDIDITPGDQARRGITQGRLAGHILLDQSTLPGMQAQIDELARSLISSFAAADASVTPGQPSIFIDTGASPSDPLARRIAVNPALIPEQGGEPRRIRDGIGAATPGFEGDNRQIVAFVSVLDEKASFDPAAGLLSEGRITDFAAVLTTEHQYLRVQAEEGRDDARLATESVSLMRSGIEGVNLDEELQRLLVIEQNYAANATVMRTLNELLDTLLASV